MMNIPNEEIAQNLQDDIFINPWGQNADEINDLFQEIWALILHFATNAATAPTHPSRLKDLDFESITNPDEQEELTEKIEKLVKSTTNLSSPGFMGHMDSIPSTASILGDLIAAVVNNNMLFSETSQALTPLVQHVISEFITRFGFNKHRAYGLLLSGGTLSNLQAIAVARNKALDYVQSGMGKNANRSVIFCSEAAHSSIDKAAIVLGLGVNAVVKIPIDESSRMKPDLLKKELTHSINRNDIPICVIGTAGTTVTGSIDPLEEIAAICKEFGVWFHVDGAYGGGLILSSSQMSKLKGIEKADSITFNPHKWMYLTRTCSMVLFASKKDLQQHFSIAVPYTSSEPYVQNLGELSLQGSRHADILKLWLSVQHIGWNGYQKLIDYTCEIASVFRKMIIQHPDMHLLEEPQMNIVCFRLAPEWLDQEYYDDLNLSFQIFLQENRGIFLSGPVYRGRRVLRAVLLNPFIRRTLIGSLFNVINEFLNDYRHEHK